MWILLLEDEPNGYDSLADGLRQRGHSLKVAPTTDAAQEMAAHPYDAILCPGIQPPEALGSPVSAEGGPCAVALLAPDDLAVWPFDGPFDDFAVAPFDAAEVALRIALCRCRSQHDEGEVIRSGPLLIDVSNYTVSVHDERITLTFKEYELLRFLVTHPGRVFTRDRLLERVWGYDYFGGSRTIDVHIRRVRGKLPPSVAALIETVHQVGYRYAPPADAAP